MELQFGASAIGIVMNIAILVLVISPRTPQDKLKD